MVHYGKCKSDVLTIFIEPPPLPTPPKKRLHNHCFQFFMGITVVPREIEDSCYAKFDGGRGEIKSDF